jgi:hypothetical protein
MLALGVIVGAILTTRAVADPERSDELATTVAAQSEGCGATTAAA